MSASNASDINSVIDPEVDAPSCDKPTHAPSHHPSPSPFLNDVWSIYFHDPNDVNWNYDSYTRLTDISSIDEYWSIHKLLKPKLHCGMFFLMREYVFPCWDDENNRNGGCLSIKVLKQELAQVWEHLSIRLLGETILNSKHVLSKWSSVNGISTSPKKHFCIVKIWLKANDLTARDDFELDIPSLHGEILYRSNQENIQHNNASQSQSQSVQAGT